MEKKERPQRENKTKTITIRIQPSIHEILTDQAKKYKISLSRYMTEASIKLASTPNSE